MNANLTEEQRRNVEQALLRALRVRYPGRAISIDWDDPDALPDSKPAARKHDDLAGGPL